MSNDASRIAHILAHTSQRDPGRACFLLHVRPEKLAEYLEVHQHVWQEMRDALTSSGWHDYSLFVEPETGLVVGYFEADDTAAAMAAMAGNEVDAKWQAEMAQYFVQPHGGSAQLLAQYFHLA